MSTHMTTGSHRVYLPAPPSLFPNRNVGAAWHRAAREIGALVGMVVAFAPIMMVAFPGVWRVVGVLYLLLYALVLAPSTTAYLLLILDGLLILRKKRPLLLSAYWAEADARPNARHNVTHALERFFRYTVAINPLANLAEAVLDVALRLRTEFVLRLLRQARANRDSARAAAPQSQRRAPPCARTATAVAIPLVERLPAHGRSLITI